MQAVIKPRQSIQQLSRQLANQIAAGEVVERPASVVKELLENSLDAGATKIDIDIWDGGTSGIRVRDNGSGIPRDELELALSPHATSKIASLDDLIHVVSMGFRGEALASIASVSETTLTSHHDDMAWSIKSREGQFQLAPASHPQGTTLEVNNLFYNTPARRKFLRSERTEYRHVEDVVKRIALARFDVAFNFRHNSRKVFLLTAAKTNEAKNQRLARLINKEFIQSAVVLDFENAGLKLWGWLASPEYSRSQSDMQYFFVNGRMIKDKVITHAVRQAYDNTLYPGRFPVYVLHLEMDPEQVDVNVHPTKHEVRFRQTRLVHDFLYHSLHQALAMDSHIPEMAVNNFPGLTAVSSAENKPRHKHYSRELNSEFKPMVKESSSAYHLPPESKGLSYPLGVALAKLHDQYLVAQNNKGLLLVSLVLARKRILQNRINANLSAEKKLVAKPVLLPFSLKLQVNALAWLENNKECLQQFGFDFSLFGENDVMVRQVPAMMDVADLKEVMNQFIQGLQYHDINSELVSLALVETLAGQAFSQQPRDWNILLRELEQLDDIADVYHQVSAQDLAQWFS